VHPTKKRPRQVGELLALSLVLFASAFVVLTPSYGPLFRIIGAFLGLGVVANIANVLAVPEIGADGFVIRYPGFARHVRPSNVAWVAQQGLNRSLVVRERKRVLSHRIVPASFKDGLAVSDAVLAWARANGVRIR
jgi:hypothetical protein